MVYYCSVKGCKNNSKMKKKDPNIVLSFHAFPAKEATKQKWLRAIGRSSWKPPSFARICSIHFDLDHISHDGCRIRMMEDACPVNGLPPNSNFEASDLEVCRVCLAADVKIFSLQEGVLNTCLQSFSCLKVLDSCSIEGMPQFVCYECSSRLIHCYNLIEQSAIAQAVLLDLFNKNGMVTKSLVKSQDRKVLGLESSLQCCILTKSNQYIYNECSENGLHKVKDTEIQSNYTKENDFEVKTEENMLNDLTRNRIETATFIEKGFIKEESITEMVDVSDNKTGEVLSQKYYDDVEKLNRRIDNLYHCKECDMDFITHEARRVHLLTSKQHRRKPDLCDPTPSDCSTKTRCNKCGVQFPSMKDLVSHTKEEHPRPKRSLNEGYPVRCDNCEETLTCRREHWLHVRRRHPDYKHTYEAPHNSVCQRCGKQFQNSTKLLAHELRHLPARVRCPSCPRIFHHKYALARHATTHARAAHHCPLCARAFKNKHNLVRHQRVHTGETPYICNLCDKRFKHSTSLKLHVRSVHCNMPPKRTKLTNETE